MCVLGWFGLGSRLVTWVGANIINTHTKHIKHTMKHSYIQFELDIGVVDGFGQVWYDVCVDHLHGLVHV